LWAARLGINAVYGPLIGRSGQHCIQPNGYNEGADQFVSDIIVAAHRHGWTVTTRLDPRAAGTRGLGVNYGPGTGLDRIAYSDNVEVVTVTAGSASSGS
jgi:hypothetical protein